MTFSFPFFRGVLIALTTINFALNSSCTHRVEPTDVKSEKKTKTASAQETKSTELTCDLEQMKDESSKSSKAALECAYNSLLTAGSLTGPGLAKQVYDVVSGGQMIYGALTDGGELIGDLATYIRNGGVDPDSTNGGSTSENIQKLQTVFDAKFWTYETTLKPSARSAMYRCLSGQYLILKDVMALFDLTTKLKDSDGLSMETIQAFTMTPLTFTNGLSNLISTSAQCSMWLDGKRSIAMQRLIKGAQSIQQPVLIIMTLANCGVSLGKGGYILTKNSMCLADDLKKYYAGRERLDTQRDQYVSTAYIPKDDNDTGINVCMRKYGIWLQKQSFYTYLYRANICADHCSKTEKRQYYLESKSSEIFPVENDRRWCLSASSTASTRDAVRSCAAMCCDQDGECTDQAMTKTGLN